MKHPFLIVIALILVIGCEKEVRIDLQNEDKLIVDGLVTDVKGNNYIKLYSTQDYYSNTPPDSVSGALVTITDNAGNFTVFSEKPATHGNYCNENFQGKAGSTYKLQIQYKGETYRSSSLLPPAILKTEVSYNPKTNKVDFSFYSTQKDTNCYKLCIFLNNIQLDSLQWLVVIDGHSKLNGKDTSLNLIHSQSDSLKIEEQSITRDVFQYYLNLLSYMGYQEQPFDVPPVFPTGNISNGALGIFRASSIVTRKIKL
jgi:hypothetical protein